MYTTKWIEGETNLSAFCLRCFKEQPQFTEGIAHCGEATIHRVYKFRADRQEYVPMFFLFMRKSDGTVPDNQLSELKHMPYEQIKTDRTALLMP